jgi:hypothetical protein
LSQSRATAVENTKLNTVTMKARSLQKEGAENCFAGVDHLLAGSDYFHQIGSPQKMVDSIESLDISEDVERKCSVATRPSCWTSSRRVMRGTPANGPHLVRVMLQPPRSDARIGNAGPTTA